MVADHSTEAGRETILAACPEPDILVGTCSPPPISGDFRDVTTEDWQEHLAVGLIGPIEFMKAVVDGMAERGFGRIVNITSAMVKTPLSPMGLSTGARAGLTSVSKALSKDVARSNVTINNLLPERIDTDRQRGMAQLHSDLAGISIEEAYDAMKASIAAGRLGRPEEFGDACAFLCSAQAGFISGQNIQLDGGSYAGVL